jgi:hypothetical protein
MRKHRAPADGFIGSKAKPQSLFIKLDISKAFDSISSIFLLETLQALGFGQRWGDWIATVLATS